MPLSSYTSFLIFAMTILLMPFHTAATPAGCRKTPDWQAMEVIELSIAGKVVNAKVADSSRERQAGMQWLCPAQVAAYPILFLFGRAEAASFHMNNVFAPLDIAFVAADGRIVGIERMELGGGADSQQLVVAALEATAGSFARWGLRVGDRIALPQR
jgi:uncharacterized membrane protein (UPF0127 family)